MPCPFCRSAGSLLATVAAGAGLLLLAGIYVADFGE
jgi:hypothetical protein